MDQDVTRGDTDTEAAVRHVEDDCADPIAHRRKPGVPPGTNDDVDGYDESIAESFPASDPPATY